MIFFPTLPNASFSLFDLYYITIQVPYRISYLFSKGDTRDVDLPATETIEDLSKWPGQGRRFNVEEPIVDVSIGT